MRVSWQELRSVCVLLGCVDARIRGDHLIMTKPGLARPVVIKMDRSLGEDIIRSNMQTLGIQKKEFIAHLETVKRRRKGKKKKKKERPS